MRPPRRAYTFPAVDKPQRSIARSVAKVAVGLVLGCAIAEGAFHLRDGGAFPHVNVYVPDDELGVRLRPGATEKISFGGNPITSVRINGDGYRGADWEAPGGDEAIVFGDSQVFGLGVEEDETFSAAAGRTPGAPKIRNAGVPTYGPVEMEKELSRLVATRKPKTVVYAVNFVNDPFEAERPNKDRHRVWDGWAVRTDTAPASVTAFPGRRLLFAESHAVFALRQWMHSFSAAPAARLPSEGAAQDLLDLDAALAKERARAADETLARWERDEAARRAATLEAINAEQRVKQIAFKQQKLQGESAGVYLVAGASPGDIVIPQLGEEGSPLAATADFVNQAAELRTKIEAKMREDARANPQDPLSADAISALAHRDDAEVRARKLLASPVAILRATQPIVQRALAAKKIAEAGGARFVLLVLPMDVQVSDDEWKKYGAEKRDMKPARVLVDDLVSAVRDAGATAIDPTDALAAAEPGAFLDGDPHMTPKGHEVVGKMLAAALAEPAPAPSTPASGLALPEGRSRVPSPSEWDRVGELQVHGSDALRCRTQKIREWMLVRCKKSEKDPAPHEIRVLRSGNDEAMTFVSPEMSTLLAPIVRGQKFLAHFSWPGRASDLNSDWMATAAETDRRFVKAETPPDPPRAADHALLSACLASEKREVASFIGGANADCERTWAKDCKRMIACAEGSPMSAPICPAGQVNAGAALWCKKSDDAALDASPSTSPTAPPASSPAPIEPGDAPFDQAAFKNAAIAYLDAARSYGDTCHLTCEEPGNWFDFICYDTCDTSDAKVKPALDAFAALEPFDETRAPRAALAFVGHARALRDFLAGVPKAKVARGTLALFQETALAYAAFDPGSKVALVPKVPLDEFFVKHPAPGVSYIWEQPRCIDESWKVVECLGKVRRVTGYELRAHRGTPLIWRMGAQGPFLTD
jgi:hypothetical protein